VWALNHTIKTRYDAEADVLYINFKKPSHATGSEMTAGGSPGISPTQSGFHL
jgi:hypothetical protein